MLARLNKVSDFAKKFARLEIREWFILVDEKRFDLKNVVLAEEGVLIKLNFNSVQIFPPTRVELHALSVALNRRVTAPVVPSEQTAIGTWPDGTVACLAVTMSYGEIYECFSKAPAVMFDKSVDKITVRVNIRDTYGNDAIFKEIFRSYPSNGVFCLFRAESGRRSEFKISKVPRTVLRTASKNFEFSAAIADVTVLTDSQKVIDCFSVFAETVVKPREASVDFNGEVFEVSIRSKKISISMRFAEDYESAEILLCDAYLTIN